MSTSCGWAILDDGDLVESGLIKVKDDHLIYNDLIEDYKFIDRADKVSRAIGILTATRYPDFIYIEQTNSGSFRTSQKMLEFIHYSVLKILFDLGYQNKINYVDTSAWRATHKIWMSKDDKKNNRLVSQGKKRGRITKKHLAVQWANIKYNLALKLKDNDIAEAIAIAAYGYGKEKLRTGRINLDAIFNGESHD